MTLYDVLGMPPQASHAELRRAYLGLARRSHPDVYATADPATRRAAGERMRSLNEVWSVLGDAERRRVYDQHLAAERLAVHHGGPPFAPGRVAYGPHRPHPPRPGGPHPGHGAWTGPSWPTSGPSATPTPGGAAGRSEQGGSPSADWRRFASPGPATDRTLGARLGALVPVALVGLALLLAALGVLMGRSSLVALAGATMVAASLAFLAAPILAMKEARRHQRRRPPRTVTAHP